MGKKPKGRGKQSAQKRMKAVADTNLHHIERTSSKQVSASAMNITAYRDQKVKWTTDEMDVDCGRNGCGWSWKLASNETKVLLDFLSTLHTMTWGDWNRTALITGGSITVNSLIRFQGALLNV